MSTISSNNNHASFTILRLLVLIAKLLILLVIDTDAVILECDFKYYQSAWGSNYACIAQNLRINLFDRNVAEVKGLHDAPKTNDDVEKVFIKKQFCPYLPLNLGRHFKNLKTLYVMNSNVQYLMDGDLDGLPKLKNFDVSHNPIETISKDFFKGHGSIEIISFFDCHLKVIDPRALDPLENLREAHFQYNVCIREDFLGSDVKKINDLKAEIRKNCNQKTNVEKIFAETKSCMSEMNQEMSFATRNANLIISFFLIVVIGLSVALIQIFRNAFRNNWRELRDNLM